MADRDEILRAVAQVTRSPMNARRWLLTLDCGHEKWVTASRRPKVGKKLRCLALACLVGEEKEIRVQAFE